MRVICIKSSVSNAKGSTLVKRGRVYNLDSKVTIPLHPKWSDSLTWYILRETGGNQHHSSQVSDIHR